MRLTAAAHSHARRNAHTHTHACMHTVRHTDTYTYMCKRFKPMMIRLAHTHTRRHSLTNTHTHTHTHTRSYMCTISFVGQQNRARFATFDMILAVVDLTSAAAHGSVPSVSSFITHPPTHCLFVTTFSHGVFSPLIPVILHEFECIFIILCA